MKNNKITVLLVEPGKFPRTVHIDNDLHTMQRIVNGYIEQYMPFDDDVAIICDEDGKINGEELNRAIYANDASGEKTPDMVDIIAGTFLLAYAPFESEKFCSLPDDLLEKYEKLFHCPEYFFRTDKGIKAAKYEPISID